MVSLANSKAFRKYKLWNELWKRPSSRAPPFFYGAPCLAHQKKEPEPSYEGPGMIRQVVPGAWA